MAVQSKQTKCKRPGNEFKREAVPLVTEGGLSIAQANLVTMIRTP